MTEPVGDDRFLAGLHANGRVVRAAIAPAQEHRTDILMSTPNSTNAATATKSRRGRPTVAELRERPLHLDRLWDVEHIATFLGFSVRLTEEIIKDPRVPQPRLVAKGGERRWSPMHWREWMDAPEVTYLGEIVDDAETRVTEPAGEMAVL